MLSTCKSTVGDAIIRNEKENEVDSVSQKIQPREIGERSERASV